MIYYYSLEKKLSLKQIYNISLYDSEFPENIKNNCFASLLERYATMVTHILEVRDTSQKSRHPALDAETLAIQTF